MRAWMRGRPALPVPVPVPSCARLSVPCAHGRSGRNHCALLALGHTVIGSQIRYFILPPPRPLSAVQRSAQRETCLFCSPLSSFVEVDLVSSSLAEASSRAPHVFVEPSRPPCGVIRDTANGRD